MSTFTFASASARKMRPATPGLVRHAEQRDPRLGGRVGDGGDEGVLHRFLFRDDNGTGSVVEARSAVDPHAVVARVLDRAQLEHAGSRGRHLEHLLEGEHGELAGVGHDPRVRAEDPGDVGVDLADLGAQRRGERDRRGVRAAAPERRHVVARRDALKAGDQHDLLLIERRRDAVGADVEDPRLGVGGVGDDAGLRAGQRQRLVAEVVDRHRAQRAGDPLAGRAACPSRARSGSGETSSAIAISSSVVLPRAERTATTRWPASRLATMRRAACLMRSASATEVPPNFITMMLMGAWRIPQGRRTDPRMGE